MYSHVVARVPSGSVPAARIVCVQAPMCVRVRVRVRVRVSVRVSVRMCVSAYTRTRMCVQKPPLHHTSSPPTRLPTTPTPTPYTYTYPTPYTLRTNLLAKGIVQSDLWLWQKRPILWQKRPN